MSIGTVSISVTKINRLYKKAQSKFDDLIITQIKDFEPLHFGIIFSLIVCLFNEGSLFYFKQITTLAEVICLRTFDCSFLYAL